MKVVKILIVFVFLIFATLPVLAKENTIKVKAGSTFKFKLKSNPTTGYHWQLAEALDEDIIKLVSSNYIVPKTSLTGSGGEEIWIFRGIKKGQAKISLEYVRPWEKVQPATLNVYSIEVK
jgi:inhibitor of cysteine peptidase